MSNDTLSTLHNLYLLIKFGVTMKKINLLLLCGGGGDEHAISLQSAGYFETTLAQFSQFNVLWVELLADGRYRTKEGEFCELTNTRHIRYQDQQQSWPVDYVIPCIHGYPGETGDIQSYFKLIHLPYFGCEAEASLNCFNKITAKMWFSALGIPNTPYVFLDAYNKQTLLTAKKALQNWGSIFIKAASQGSSVGCYKVDNEDQLSHSLQQAFEFSPYVVIEKTIMARELEVAVFEHNKEIIATLPGEIVCAENTFYSFDEKYDSNSQAQTHIEANNLTSAQIETMQNYAIKAFTGLKLRHLSRIDFFLTDDNEILLNEINTFPGLTPISMFPKMLIHHGINFGDWLIGIIEKQIN